VRKGLKKENLLVEKKVALTAFSRAEKMDNMMVAQLVALLA
jgi:hypothetical protein